VYHDIALLMFSLFVILLYSVKWKPTNERDKYVEFIIIMFWVKRKKNYFA